MKTMTPDELRQLKKERALAVAELDQRRAGVDDELDGFTTEELRHLLWCILFPDEDTGDNTWRIILLLAELHISDLYLQRPIEEREALDDEDNIDRGTG